MLRLLVTCVVGLVIATGCSTGHSSSTSTAQGIFRTALADLKQESRVHVIITDTLAPSGLAKVDASFHDGDVDLARTYSLGVEHVRVVDGFSSVYAPKALVKAWYPKESPEWVDYYANRWVSAGADGAKTWTLTNTVAFMDRFTVATNTNYSTGKRHGQSVYLFTAQDNDRGDVRMVVAAGGNPRLLHAENVTGTFTEDFTQYGTTPSVPKPREGVAP